MICKWICFMAFIAYTACQTQYPPSQRLLIEKITKVMRPGDHSGRNHSIAVRVRAHDAYPKVIQWTLTLNTLSKGPVTYTLPEDGTSPTTRREFLFEGNLLDADSIFMAAKNESRAVATCFLTLKFKDFASNIALVGANADSSSASLRVLVSEEIPEVAVDRILCKYAESPCYYIMPKPIPIPEARCIDLVAGTGEVVQVCDETVTSFNEMASKPELNLQDDKLGVQLAHNKDFKMFEVVAYDPEDRTNVFSQNGYKCPIEIGPLSSDGQKVRCNQQLTLPEGQMNMMVLVVRLDDKGAVYESTLQRFEGKPPPAEKDMTGVIVGSVIGGLVGAALIVFLVIFFLKKKKESSSRSDTSMGQKVEYTPAPTREPESTEP